MTGYNHRVNVCPMINGYIICASHPHPMGEDTPEHTHTFPIPAAWCEHILAATVTRWGHLIKKARSLVSAVAPTNALSLSPTLSCCLFSTPSVCICKVRLTIVKPTVAFRKHAPTLLQHASDPPSRSLRPSLRPRWPYVSQPTKRPAGFVVPFVSPSLILMSTPPTEKQQQQLRQL